MNARDNILKTCLFQKPEHIPVSFGVNASCYDYYGTELIDKLMSEHKHLYPGYREGDIKSAKKSYKPWQTAGVRYSDSWGCVWETRMNGITGAVVEHALEDWDHFSTYRIPSPEHHNGWGEIDWDKIRTSEQESRKCGKIVKGALRHGFFLLTLEYIRGYENQIFDMMDESENYFRLAQMVEEFNMGLVTRYLELKPDIMMYPEDLGMQDRLMLTPDMFRRHVKPVYKRLMEPARKSGTIVHMHSDGYVMEVAEDLMECGVQVLNIQDLVNGIDEMARCMKGRVCIDLDIDRQSVVRNGSAADVRDLVKEEVLKLGSQAGGLMLKHDLYPGIPAENVKALMDAMEEFMFWYK